jgi:hypothetical protein
MFFLKPKVMKKNQNEIINTIKILIYKENRHLLEKVNFDDDNIFLEPLLFAYFNSKKSNFFPNDMLKEILQGYFLEKEEVEIKFSYNSSNVAYIPNIGYFNNGEKKCFDPIFIIENTQIELLKRPIKLLENIFRTNTDELINEKEIVIDNNLFEKNINALTNAFKFIKENSPDQYKLIEENCKKVIMFKTNPNNINSFATINAHGIAFFNVYQDEYDEVFFVDDIAHQTGHIILTTFFYDKKAIFKIDEEQNIGRLLKINDNRSIHILLHAFYTYYTTFMCLDDCLKNNYFNEAQKKEAIARIGFYLNKCTLDIQIFDQIINNFKGIEFILTSKGIQIYLLIRSKYVEIFNKWNSTTKYFDYRNQAYNFTLKNFKELNK